MAPRTSHRSARQARHDRQERNLRVLASGGLVAIALGTLVLVWFALGR